MAIDNKSDGLMYKGRPLTRHENVLYYGNMSDKYIIMMQISDTAAFKNIAVATRVVVNLELTDSSLKTRDRITKKTEADGLYEAMDIGAVWLERALASK
ncbi:MAG: hypothetical protein RSA70_06350 [Clostridia bacterium]